MHIVRFGIALAALPVLIPSQSTPSPTAAPARAQMEFVENLGQWATDARFVMRQPDVVARFERGGFALQREVRAPSAQGVLVRFSFGVEGRDVEPKSSSQLPGLSHFLVGERSAWRTGVRAFEHLEYPEVRPGVGLRFREAAGILEYDVLLGKRGVVEGLRIRVSGHEGMRVDPDGSLVIATALGEIRQPRPKSWQVEADGRRTPVECDFVRHDAYSFGFTVRGRGAEREVCIDPGLHWGTYAGGIGDDRAYASATDASGLVTVAGATTSTAFPVSPGAYRVTPPGGAQDGWVMKFDPTKNGSQQRVWCTYFGGTREDTIQDVALDPNGNPVIVGTTKSTNFPTTAGAHSATFQGGASDAFVAKLSANGASLLYGTYLGGGQLANTTEVENAYQVAVPDSTNIWLVGDTDSANFPTNATDLQPTHRGAKDAYLVRLDTAQVGTAQRRYATLLGSTTATAQDLALGLGLAKDGSGFVYVTGYTNAPTGFWQTSSFGGLGGFDTFVLAVDPTLAGAAQLQWSRIMGGAEDDYGTALDSDALGGVVVAGYGYAYFPTTASAYQTGAPGGQLNTFVFKVNSVGGLVASSYCANFTGPDVALDVHLDSAGLVTIAGYTQGVYPVTPGAYQAANSGGNYGCFVARMSRGLDKLYHATMYCGTGTSAAEVNHLMGHGLEVAADGVVTLVGATTSPFLPMPSAPVPFQANHAGLSDAFAARVDLLPSGVTRLGVSTPSCRGPITLDVTAKPQIGQPFGVLCRSAPQVTPGAIVFGNSLYGAPVNILGADIFVNPVAAFGVSTDTYGAYLVEVPSFPGPLGLLYVQFVWANSPSCTGPGILSASDVLFF